MHPWLTIADRAARAAGQIITRALGNRHLDVQEKRVNDFVTEVDRQSERTIINAIRQAYPQHSILAEESGTLAGSEDTRWLIDPLDGTTNFIHGLPCFCISIAIQRAGQLEHGLIYDPIRQESFYASRGQGAWVTYQGRGRSERLRVSGQQQLRGALLSIGYPPRDPTQLECYWRVLHPLSGEIAGSRHFGSAALALAYVACGRLDGFWEFNLKPWDIAAGSLLIQEAGGIVCDSSGGQDYLETGTLVGANPKLCQTLMELSLEPLGSLE